jgi:hypothetical protein
MARCSVAMRDPRAGRARRRLALARQALASDDLRQRGTALEYLQNVLPEPLRSELITRLT